ncbi:thiolase family protein [Amycolatopsis pithecellobii]|uniref:Thiolase family protein n=1 Tax=Amycolatopsis pithecellobii TaxID=664692 RepID=A0A6N7YZH9_9PSEU|nr:thiolase family protein [Amycolatopsis pithecellobii]MTD54323.1 thiolase family protein [Amycolatopsis pithecellobii]
MSHAIVGIGETRVGKQPGWTAVDLQAEAVIRACADAGISVGDLDGLFNLGPYSRPFPMFSASLNEYLGLRLKRQGTIDVGGIVSPSHMLNNAIASIERGECSLVVCTFGEAAATGRTKAGRGWTMAADDLEFEAPFGLVGSVLPYALVMSRHIAEYGTRMEGFGAVALAARKHAMLTENAVMRKPLSMDDYLSSRPIASPIKLLDSSVIVDGAGAVIVASEEVARELGAVPVRVRSSAMKSSHRNIGQFPGVAGLGIDEVGARALQGAGLSLPDIDLLQVHDAFTISVIVFLEELGFCKRGTGGDYALDGNLELGADCPVNTNGGHLSQGHVSGMLHITEAVRQLRGEAGERQLEDPRFVMVAGAGGYFGMTGVMILGRD